MGWLNQGIGGDKVQNVLWRIVNDCLPTEAERVVIIAGGNNIGCDPPRVIVEAVVNAARHAQQRCKHAAISVVGILPRVTCNIKTIEEINISLHTKCNVLGIGFVPVDARFIYGGYPNEYYFWEDGIHLNEQGYILYNDMISGHIQHLPSIRQPNPTRD